jgi:transglutaminase-like putative cysteine protease
MKGIEFKRLAEEGGRVYGDSDWYFLRELAQNARDAGATRIEVTAGCDPDGSEWVSFLDDGSGMTREHAREYLFRLYASSKEDLESAAGLYGIGFWTVLRFLPQRIVVESCCNGASWGVVLDASLDAHDARGRLERHGTRITLSRSARCTDEMQFLAEVAREVDRFCSRLRRNDRKSTPLPAFLNGRACSRPLEVSSPMSLSFTYGKVEGAVGLGPQPRVELLARGLPVWEGTLLDELAHDRERRAWKEEVGQGLCPVFVLNGNDLRVILARNAVVDDAALARLRRAAERALSRLLLHQLARAFPSGPLARLAVAWENLVRWAASVHPAWWTTLATFVVAVSTVAVVAWSRGLIPSHRTAGAGGVATSATDAGPPGDGPHTGSTPSEGRLPRGARSGGVTREGTAAYQGAGVDPQNSVLDTELYYEPATPAWFKLASADRYAPDRGLVPAVRDPERYPRPRDFVCTPETCFLVRLTARSAGWLTLPAPSGFSVEASSIRVDGSPSPDARCVLGETLVKTAPGRHTVTYECGRLAADEPLPDADLRLLRDTGVELAWPADTRAAIDAARGLPLQERIRAAADRVASMVAYDTTPETVAAYSRMREGAEADWLAFVLRVGKGDCDVLNGVNALLLRELGVPARLALGVVGDRGTLPSPVLAHAWTEYFAGRWEAVDVSAGLGAGAEARASPAPGSGTSGTRVAGSETSGTRPEDSAAPGRDAPLPGAGTRGAPAEEVEGKGGLRGGSGGLPGALVSRPRGDAVPGPGAGPGEGLPAAHGLSPGAPVSRQRGDGDRSPRDGPDAGAWEGTGFGTWPFVALAATMLVLIVVLALRRQRERLSGAEGGDEAREVLARAALAAMVRPRAWAHAPALQLYKLLPRIRGARISIARARRLAARGRLFAGTQGTPLVQEALSAGAVVLDLSQGPFVPLIRSLPGVTDLDRTEALRPVAAGSTDLGGLLSHAGRVLRRCGGWVEVKACTGLGAADFRDVDLSGLGLARSSRWAPRFIAVNPEGSQAGQWRVLYSATPGLAVYRFLLAAVSQSAMVPFPSDVMRRAARLLLEEESA